MNEQPHMPPAAPVAEGVQAVEAYDWSAMREGTLGIFSLAGLVMAMGFLGFGAFVRSLDFPLLAAFSTNILIWALPGQLVFVDTWHKGVGLLVVALAVGLTAVRLLPITVLVLSKVRMHGQPRWPEFLLAHFIAVTVWIIADQRVEGLPKPRRLPWLVGLGVALVASMSCVMLLGYALAGQLPPTLSATLAYFTPAFFLISQFGGARWRFDYWAIGLGCAIGPVASLVSPQFDLLIAGVIGGTLAFFIARPGRKGLL